jgi:hypothetical protein
LVASLPNGAADIRAVLGDEVAADSFDNELLLAGAALAA